MITRAQLPAPRRARWRRLRPWAAGVLALVLAATPGTARAWDPGSSSSESAAELVALHNAARVAVGRRGLRVDPVLSRAARWRARDMAVRNYFGHTILGTRRRVFWYLQYRYDLCFKLAGENLGRLSWPGASVADVDAWIFDAWMESESHRENILGRAWDSIGIGAYRGADGQYTWTVLFADRC